MLLNHGVRAGHLGVILAARDGLRLGREFVYVELVLHDPGLTAGRYSRCPWFVGLMRIYTVVSIAKPLASTRRSAMIVCPPVSSSEQQSLLAAAHLASRLSSALFSRQIEAVRDKPLPNHSPLLGIDLDFRTRSLSALFLPSELEYSSSFFYPTGPCRNTP